MSKSYYNNLNKQPGNNFTTGRNNDIIDIYNTLKEISGRNKQNGLDTKTTVPNIPKIPDMWGGMDNGKSKHKKPSGHNKPHSLPHRPDKDNEIKIRPLPYIPSEQGKPKFTNFPGKPFDENKVQPLLVHIPKEKKEQERLKRATGGYDLKKISPEKIKEHLHLKEKTPDDYYSLSVPQKELNKRLDNEAFGPKTDFSIWNFENNYDKLNKEEQGMLIHKMQLALNNEGYKDYNGYPLKPDGIFGNKTKSVYERYKKDKKDELEDYKSEVKPMSMNFTDFNTPTYIKTRNILIDNANKKINSSANNSNSSTANNNQNSNTNKNGNNDELIIRDAQNNSAKESIMYQPRPQEIFNKGFSVELQNNNKDDSTHSNNQMQENINNDDVYSVKEEHANTNNERLETYKKYEKDNVIVYNAIKELYKTLDVINSINKDEIDPNIDVEKMKADVERLIERMKKIGDEKVVKDIPVIGHRLNNVEKVLYADDPIKAMGIMTEGALSRYDTMRKYGDGYETNNNSDAYRHAIWNATSSAHYGNEFTQDWMNAHEYGFSDNFNEDSLLGTYMDLYNNSIGRYQGDKSNPREKRIGITKRINDRVQSGGLYRIDNGELVTTNKVEEDKER